MILWQFLIKWIPKKFNWMTLGKIHFLGGRGGVPSLQPIWLKKSALELLVTNPRSPFQSWCDHPFYKSIVCPFDLKTKGIKCICPTEQFFGNRQILASLSIRTLYSPSVQFKPIPWRLWGGCHPQRHNFWTFQLRGTKWLFQNFDWMCCLGN